MLLRELEIKNYRSLEHVSLTHLDKFNVLIGRNNSGKSAVFGALELLNRSVRGQQIDWNGAITASDRRRALELRLLFLPSSPERQEFLSFFTGPHFEGHRDAMDASSLFRKLEYVFRSNTKPPGVLHLHEMRLMTEDGKTGTIQQILGSEDIANPEARVCLLTNIVNDTISRAAVESDQFSGRMNFHTHYAMNVGNLSYPDPATLWLLRRLDTFLEKAFFFNPFRHSTAQLEVQQSDQLAQDGSNLAQTLLTLLSHNRSHFDEVETLLHVALPDIGRLQTPVIDKQTELRFLANDGNYFVRLHDMGGGVEQLLMIATVLLTTDSGSSLFLEEPESHLHAGAQRFLIERLYESDRQIFLTTHSPIFINSPRPSSTYQVKFTGHRTTVNRIANMTALSTVLEDIGSRNSDVLLSDAVLFVEGPGDQSVLQTWSKTLGKSIEEHNITVLPLGGGAYAERTASARSEVLEHISNRAPVPHIFVLDRDERSDDSVKKFQDSLTDKLHILERRELENYLLIPRALLAALREKYKTNLQILERINEATEVQVERIIRESADNLFDTVLIKRIRAEIGIIGGMLPPHVAAELIPHAGDENLHEILQEKIGSLVSKHLADLDLAAIVDVQRAKLTAEWTDADARLLIAPGEELIAAVFRNYGGEYKKPGDAHHIAQQMTADEIPDEIKQLLNRTVEMTSSSTA